jgi:phosphoribosyl-ATP pyrophosphohydrolase
LDDAVARHAKILEEAAELVEATSRTQARAEAADLLFHVLVELTAHDTSLSQVVAELEARRGRRRMD